MYGRNSRVFIPPPPKTPGQAQHQLFEAQYEKWFGNDKEAFEILINVANYCAERSLSGETQQGSEEESQTGKQETVYVADA